YLQVATDKNSLRFKQLLRYRYDTHLHHNVGFASPNARSRSSTQDAEDDILLPGKHITSEHRTVGSSSKRPAWVALGLPVKLRACVV
ncbi:hypothetical protein P692DRAFT_20840737, partial [Suillus brevipes Sb2]